MNSSKTEEGEQKAKNHKAEGKAKKRNRKTKGLELMKNRKWLQSFANLLLNSAIVFLIIFLLFI